MLAGPIIDRARVTLIDPFGARWSDADLYKWLSDGQRAIATMAPSSTSVVRPVGLVAGSSQQLPAQASMLLAAYRNTTGRAVRIIERELLDAYRPTWHRDPATAEVTNYMFDPDTPRLFSVYPPNTGEGVLDIQYAIQPADITMSADVLVIDDIYAVALFDYVMYRALQKDDDFAAGAQADSYHKSFIDLVAKADAMGDTTNPNLNMLGFAATPREAAR